MATRSYVIDSRCGGALLGVAIGDTGGERGAPRARTGGDMSKETARGPQSYKNEELLLALLPEVLREGV